MTIDDDWANVDRRFEKLKGWISNAFYFQHGHSTFLQAISSPESLGMFDGRFKTGIKMQNFNRLATLAFPNSILPP